MQKHKRWVKSNLHNSQRCQRSQCFKSTVGDQEAKKKDESVMYSKCAINSVNQWSLADEGNNTNNVLIMTPVREEMNMLASKLTC